MVGEEVGEVGASVVGDNVGEAVGFTPQKVRPLHLYGRHSGFAEHRLLVIEAKRPFRALQIIFVDIVGDAVGAVGAAVVGELVGAVGALVGRASQALRRKL